MDFVHKFAAYSTIALMIGAIVLLVMLQVRDRRREQRREEELERRRVLNFAKLSERTRSQYEALSDALDRRLEEYDEHDSRITTESRDPGLAALATARNAFWSIDEILEKADFGELSPGCLLPPNDDEHSRIEFRVEDAISIGELLDKAAIALGEVERVFGQIDAK